MNTAEASREAYREMATFLRQNPQALNMKPDELAACTGLPEEVVREVLQGAKTKRPSNSATATKTKGGATRFARGILGLFDRLTGRPLLFIGLSTALMILAIALIGSLSSGTGGRGVEIEVAQGLLILVVVVLQMATYYRHARARNALYGGLLLWLMTTPIVILQLVLSRDRPEELGLPLLVSAMVMAFFVLSLIYAGIGVACSIIGGYVQVRRADLVKERLTRQQLLERLFQIEERLRSGPASPTRTGSIFERRWAKRVRENPFPYALVAGLAISLLQVLGIGGVQALLGETSSNSLVYGFGGLVIGLITAVVQIALCFLAGRPWRAVAVSLVFTAVSVPATFIPLGAFGMKWVVANWPEGWITALAYSLVLGLVAGLGALIEERAALEARLNRDDPAALLAEMIEIQRRLTPSTAMVCVMVVDAAKSSMMKAEADPLEAEWTFRAYQKFIEDIATRFGGRIHSTAGDGAVAYFDDCTRAFAAARTIQTEVGDFNVKVSRLKSPFRLRIGLHCGTIAGELEKVEFTEVIDIAAHVESHSQVGGILVTDPVSSHLEGEALAELKDTVDGFKVFMSLNPTLGP
ncbi:MAG TPA: adenylate/guanylate cyclase domain-containing protein [Fimbriimonadaceae bacterium]|nr:adenylate/guanylate cyclase domain-containing protein [Fimbriimonadaceae bacterium]HRJ96664.1 adenylate/guanylate cyclase domain-containing protein [Fimbriimonadaceae bacterium]